VPVRRFNRDNPGFFVGILPTNDCELETASTAPYTTFMNLKHFAVAFLFAAGMVAAQDNLTLGLLEEKLNKLRADVEDLQFRQQKTEKLLESIQADVKELRRNSGAVSSDDLKTLEAKIAAVDAARQKDRQVIIDELAKQLAAIGGGPKPVPTTSGGKDGKEYVVQKGDTLSTIARTHGTSVAALKKANNLASDDLKVGQKLLIP